MKSNGISKTIIELQDIVKIFKVKIQDVLVLKKINFQIEDGEFVILFGPSGCGKSTALHVMLGLENPSAGKALFLDYDLYKMSEDGRSQFRKNHIGMVYQQPNWIKSLTVLENVLFSTSLLGIGKVDGIERAREVLEKVGMLDWAYYHPTELSSGQQQRISFARALVTDPKVVIADEPTGNLDYKSGIELMDLFKETQKKGKTIIMVTHNVENIDYADKVIQMFDGNIVNVHKVTPENKEKIKKIVVANNVVEKTEKELQEEAELVKKYRIEPEHITVEKPTFSMRLRSIVASLPTILPRMREFMKSSVHSSLDIGSFLIVLLLYLLNRSTLLLKQKKLIPEKIVSRFQKPTSEVYQKIYSIFDRTPINDINRTELIDLSIKNMLVRKSRSLITVGGMAIGIASIVFLVSIGYGLERLVISRVARLDEMKQIDATPAVSSNVKITDKTLADISNLPTVEKVLPVIGVVGKVNFSNSNTDVAVYGVLADYLKESAIKPTEGEIFASNDQTVQIASRTGSTDFSAPESEDESDTEVLGVASQVAVLGEEKGAVTFKINPGNFVRVRAKPQTRGTVLGYTKRVEGVQDGAEYWGSSYTDNDNGQSGEDEKGNALGNWIGAKVPLWKETVCTQETDAACELGKYIPLRDDAGSQVFEDGYFAMIGMEVDRSFGEAVLGVSDEKKVLAATDSAALVDATDEATLLLQELLTTEKPQTVNTIDLPSGSKRVAVVNESFLQVLGISNKRIGTPFDISFIATGSLVDNKERIETSPTEYSIVGVIKDTSTPIIYVPLTDLKQMGLNNYSQAKIVLKSENDLRKTREQIEVLGLNTSSVADTVAQIEGFFGTIRIVLGLLGVVALSVAALGMFNTLTISLLERTHEVGMMKAIGMKSYEVKDLFITESMIMGVFGGLGGLFIGFAVGKGISIIISAFTLVRGIGFIDVSYIPPGFVLLIVSISIIVGIVTGVYPARRATRISALDALRYE
ncbi:ATP-binding cassette domain-containing protein [Candidatus Woesebacteria bacterium]|nr:ATP-binding cassette domain-containing protein [Candidatus Woesebacteria bacterium]